MALGLRPVATEPLATLIPVTVTSTGIVAVGSSGGAGGGIAAPAVGSGA
jgi:hypothetical protein